MYGLFRIFMQKKGRSIMSLLHLLFVGIGGFFGSIARFSLSQLGEQLFPIKLPVATLSVNLLGSFLLGMLLGIQLDELWLVLFGTGFLGAFTTFSTFILENLQLFLQKEKWLAFIYILISLVSTIVCAFFGYSLAQVI